jgi:signal transduction histidine kinase
MRKFILLVTSLSIIVLLFSTALSFPVEDIYHPSDNETETPANADSLIKDLLSRSWSLRNNNPDLSIQYGMQAMELARKINDFENLTKSYSFVGVAYRLLGNYMQAIDIFFEGLSLAKKHNIPQQEGYAYINIANLYIYLEYFNTALENLDNALEIVAKIDDKEMLSYIYLNRGRVLMALIMFEEARQSITNSLQLRIETNNISGQAVCYKYIGDIYFNEVRYSEALQNYEQALDVVDYESDRHLVGNIYLKMAEISCNQKQVRLAEENALTAFKIGQEVNSRLIIHDALKVLSKVDIEMKRFESAAQRLQLTLLYADTLTNQKVAEKVLNTEFEWERQRRQAEIDLLNKDKEIQRLRLSRQRGLNYALIIFASLILAGSLILLVLLKKIKDKNNILLHQKEELDHINKAKDKMFMVIGHDLRGPIWTLKALIELIREEEEVLFQNNNTSENFNALTRSVQAVSDLLENLLYWAKAEDGKLVFSPATANLNSIVNQSIQSYKPWATLKSINIENEVPENYKLYADENMLKTMMRNLLSNAIKFTHRDGKVIINVCRENGFHKITVTDNGIGFNPELADSIFNKEKFHSTKGTGNEFGSGIGLTLCREFAEKHGGAVWAKSEPGKGSKFYFTVPA